MVSTIMGHPIIMVVVIAAVVGLVCYLYGRADGKRQATGMAVEAESGTYKVCVVMDGPQTPAIYGYRVDEDGEPTFFRLPAIRTGMSVPPVGEEAIVYPDRDDALVSIARRA